LNFVNIDALVFASSPDLEDAVEGKIKDYFYLANLSEDVAESWAPMVLEIEQQVSVYKQKPAGEQFTESELQRMANAKLALLSLRQTWERLDKKYGDATEVKELYFKESEELPDYIKEQRKMASTKLGELRGYKVMAQDKALYATTINTLVSEIDAMVLVVEDQDLYEYEYTLLYEYRRPFISTRLEYYPSPKVTKIPPTAFPAPSASPSPLVQ
jgi:hypothetical protein